MLAASDSQADSQVTAEPELLPGTETSLVSTESG